MLRSCFVSIVTTVVILPFLLIGCSKKTEEPIKPKRQEVAAEPGSKKADMPAKPEIPAPSAKPITEEKVLFSFENGDTGSWEIPDWAFEKNDNAAVSIETSSEITSEGKSSLKLDTDFPGDMWTAALIEQMQYFDFSPYREIAADLYIPKDAPLGLRAKIILSVGDKWTFSEMARNVPLVPGEWVTVRASVEPGSYDWKKIIPDESFRQDVRKIAVRVESNKKPVYKGPIYIDNIRIGK